MTLTAGGVMLSVAGCPEHSRIMDNFRLRYNVNMVALRRSREQTLHRLFTEERLRLQWFSEGRTRRVIRQRQRQLRHLDKVLDVLDVLIRHIDSEEHLENRPFRHCNTMKIEAMSRLFIAVARQELFFHRERLVVMLAIAEAELPSRMSDEMMWGIIGLKTTCAATASYEESDSFDRS